MKLAQKAVYTRSRYVGKKPLDPKNYTPEQVEKINQKLIEQKLITPDFYYIDLCVLKDFTLGAILHDIRGRHPEEAAVLYKNVMKGVTAYQIRQFDECDFFPGTPYTTEYVNQLLANPENAIQILVHAPVTGCMKTLESHIIINANHSQLKEKFKKVRVDKEHYYKDWKPIKFTINTYPLKFDKVGSDLVGAFFVDHFGVDVEVVYYEPKTIPVEHYTQSEEIFVYRLDQFIETPEIHDIMEPIKCMDKKLWAIPIFDPDKKREFPIPRLRNERKLLKACLDMFVSFDWLPVPVYACMPEKIPNDHGLM